MKDELTPIHRQEDISTNAAENLESSHQVGAPAFSPTAQLKIDEEEELQMKQTSIQNKSNEKEEEEELQMKKGPYQAKSENNTHSSSATKLPEKVQSQMETSFGTDFSNVKVHNDSSEAESLGARAFTQGDQLHFASGEYNPESKTGQELIAHELSHVVQQSDGRVSPTTEKNGKKVNDDRGLEQEADMMAKKAVDGGSAQMGNNTVQKKEDNQGPAQFQLFDPLMNAVGRIADAHRIHEAVTGLGTDEEAIFNTLLPLNKNQIKALKIVYRSMYGVGLMQDLRDDLTDGEMKTALIYMYYYPFENDIIGSFQCERAVDRILTMSGYQIEIFTNALDFLNNNQRSYLWKALAANNSLAAISIFAMVIQGKDDDWLQNNCQLTNHTDGTGIKQQWSHSCNATTVQAMRGQMDPIYAYLFILRNNDISAANDNDGMAANPSMAAEQKEMLESDYDGVLGNMTGGTAVSRNSAGGVGRWADDLLNETTDDYGVSYSTLRRGDGVSYDTLMSEIKKGAKRGIPVPIIVGSGISSYAHYVMVTAMDTSQTPVVFTIHDPGAGVTVQFTEDDFKFNNLSLSSWNVLSGVEAVTEE